MSIRTEGGPDAMEAELARLRALLSQQTGSDQA